jgi:polysaccharide chain length determinant protein (PEP-CTERM system associated)
MVLIITIVGCAASFGIVQELPPIYRSEALILIDAQKIPERYVSSTVSTEIKDQLASISQEILSATRLQKIINNFGLYRDQKKKLAQEEIIDLMRKDISIELEKGSTHDHPEAFRVGYQGRNPALVAEVANQLANLFIEEDLQSRERQAEGTADFIDTQLKEAKQALDQLESKVSAYKLAHNGDLPEQQAALAATLARLQLELQGNQDALNRSQQNRVTLQGTLDTAQAAAGSPLTEQRAPRPRATNANIDPTSRKESDFLQAQYDALRQRYEPTYPRMVKLQHDIEKQKMVEDAENARIENLKTRVGLADREIQQQNNERERILKSIAQYQARIEQLPVREQEMAELTRDYENSKTNYKSLLDKKLAAGMATDMERRQQGERFTMLDPPTVPEKPISPKKPMLEGIGCALSLVLGLVFAFAKETKKNALLGEWELPEGLEILGRVPFIKPPSHAAADHDDNRPPRKSKRARVLSAALSILGAGLIALYFNWGRL